MTKRKLGKSGPELTVIGFGAWAIGGPWEFGWGPVDDAQSLSAIHRALDLGINWIDTAAVYGLGHSEEVVAEAIRGIRHEVFVATKCGMVWDDHGTVSKSLNPESIRKEIEASLRRLRTDYVDLYQIHWPSIDTSSDESWKIMCDLVKEGKTRFVGACNYAVSDMEQSRTAGPMHSLQPPYNLIKRDIEEEIIPYCLKNEIGIIAYSPMASGLLTGKFDYDKLSDDDWRRKSKIFSEPKRKQVSKISKRLLPIAHEHGMSLGELAVAWVLKNPGVTSAIVGVRSAWQIEEIAGAARKELSSSAYESIGELLSEVSSLW
jgi:aryl-alcohol dehydrogenase-like predicted oxidoreductase